METFYGLIFNRNEKNEITTEKEIIRIMSDPTLYTNESNENLKLYNLLLSKPFDKITSNGTETEFVDTAEYDLLFTAITRMFNDPTFIVNETYKSYFISNVTDNIVSSNYISFIFNNQIKLVITNNTDTFKNIYPSTDKYYVVYDESQNVENGEMLDLMVNLCNKIGKDNPYNSVKVWNYIDIGIKISFYIFYSGSNPGDIICQEVVRNYVINKYTLEVAKERFPKLFITTKRKVYCLYDNEKLPIDLKLLNDFVNEYNIIYPEVVHILDYKSPIIVEYGLSDIFTNYSGTEGYNSLNNTFLFYISQVLNYYNGKVLTHAFIEESEFQEYDEYCSVVTSGVEWDIMKKSYI